jgi:hypothetical protein
MNRRIAFKNFPEIKTKRLFLRQPTMKDAEWYYGHFSRPEIVWGGGEPGPKNVRAAREEHRKYLVDLSGRG